MMAARGTGYDFGLHGARHLDRSYWTLGLQLLRIWQPLMWLG